MFARVSPEMATDLRRDESLGEAIDHRQVVEPARAQPLHNGNIQSTEALKRSSQSAARQRATECGQIAQPLTDGATEERGEMESAGGGWNVAAD